MKLKGNRILWVRSLMIASQLLLLLFIGNWLVAQYNEQKQQLRKDITGMMSETENEISDSLVYKNVVKPIMASAKAADENDTLIIHKPGVSLSFSEDEPPIDTARFMRNLNGLLEDTTLMQRTTVRVGKAEKRIVYKSKDIDKAEKIAVPIVSMLIRELAGIEPGSKYAKLDTAYYSRIIKRRVAENDWPFTARLHVKRILFDNANYNDDDMVIERDYLEQPYTLAVNNYSGFLFKKITPQIFFSVILILLTSISFYIALRSLRSQIKLNNMKNDLISNMTHELKTPISTVKVALEAINDFNVIEQPEKTRDYLNMAYAEMNRLDMLVNQALNNSLLESGKIVLKKEYINIKDIADDTIAALKIKADQKSASVTLETSGSDFNITGDKLHLHGVLLNLIDNSLKYSQQGVIVKLSLSEDEKNVYVSVCDDGPGIPKEYIRQVFDKFFRVPTGNVHNVKGYGLGLSYCKQIVEQHNGEISAENNEASGCTFQIILPKNLS